MELASRFRDDVILRAALDEILDLFGDESKKILLYTISIEKGEGARTTVRDKEGFLDYGRVAVVIRKIFGEDAASMIIEHLDKRISELKESIV